jgi:ribonuclease VapC
MIVDSSAIIAIVLEEADYERYLDAIVEADACRMLASNWLEAAMVVDRRGDLEVGRRFDKLFAETQIEVVDFTMEHAQIARRAWHRFGKRRHLAQLNYGDCMAYALAATSGEPLLFKGNDFSKTDIAPALPA